MSDEARLLDELDEEVLENTPVLRQVRDYAKREAAERKKEQKRYEADMAKAREEHEAALEAARKSQEEAETRMQALETERQADTAKGKLTEAGIKPTDRLVREYVADGQPEDSKAWYEQNFGTVPSTATASSEGTSEEPTRPTFPEPTTLGTPPPSDRKLTRGEYEAMRANPQTRDKAILMRQAGLVVEEPWTGRPG